MRLDEFLIARIAEDEAEARVLIRDWEESPPLAYDAAQVAALDAGDPARVLAECQAKRAIVEQAVDLERHDGYSEATRDAVRALATVYADHPDYDAAWRLEQAEHGFA